MTYLNKQTKQVGLQIGLAAVCINEWKVMFDVRVSVKPERNIVKFLKYFINISWNILWNISGEKFHEILHHYFYLWQKVKFVTCSRELQIYNGKHCRSVAEFNVWHLCTILNGEVAVPAQLIDLELSARTSRGDFNQQKLYKPPTHTTEYHK